jgi:hypothetical protein
LLSGATQVPAQSISVPGQETWHDPALQTVPAPHATPAVPPSAPHWPTAPQLERLVCGSTQVPAQSISVPGQEIWHEPAAQTVPAPHTAPTAPPSPPHDPVAPQFERLVSGSMHVPAQSIWLPGQETWQEPLLQTYPFVHAAPALPPPVPQRPLAPQYERLVSGSTQVPPQSIWVPGQATAQLPFAQTFPAGQGVPAFPVPHVPLAPQLLRLVSGLTHTPPQLISLPGHDTSHDPALQTFPFVQAAPALPPPLPQSPVAPQLVGLLSGSMQAPPQFTSLPAHDTWHVPALHTYPLTHAAPAPPSPTPPSAIPQVPVAPQLDRLVSGSTHVPPQLISFPGQEIWQEPLPQRLPLLQTMPVLPPPVPQRPDAPQYELFVSGSMHVPPQSISLPGQDTWQVPFAHTLPLLHAVPALPPPFPQSPVAPQYAPLESGAMHVPPQLICVPGQATAQEPFAHTFPTAQATPAVPPPFPQSPAAPQ